MAIRENVNRIAREFILPRLALFCRFLIVAISCVLVTVAFAYAGLRNVSPLFHNGFIVFGIPAVMAVDAFVYFAWKATPLQFGIARRLVTALALSLLALVLSGCVAGFVIFNTWGS